MSKDILENLLKLADQVQGLPAAKAATCYASIGLAVFPVHTIINGQCSCNNPKCSAPGKHPRTKNGFKDATTDPKAISLFFPKGKESNIGMPTWGSIKIIDVDKRNGGLNSLKKLRKMGFAPRTLKVTNGSGGLHYYFYSSDDLPKLSGLLPGIDFLGTGGYVIVPPSRHHQGGSYKFEMQSSSIQPLPNMFKTFLQDVKRDVKFPTDWGKYAQRKIYAGHRNNELAKVTGLLLAKNVNPELAHEIVQGWNTQKCTPSLEKDEVTRIVESIAKKELQKLRGRR